MHTLRMSSMQECTRLLKSALEACLVGLEGDDVLGPEDEVVVL